MMTLLPALISIGLLAACGGGLASTRSGTAPDIMDTQSDAVPAPRRLTPSHDGGVFEMKVGRSVALVVSDPHAPDPEVEGQSVQVIEVNNITASGQREWELRAVREGRTTLRAAGAHPYVITLDVRQ